MRFSLAFFTAALAACSPSPDTPDGGGGAGGGAHCTLPDVGDPKMPIQMELTIRGIDETSAPAKDGDTVPMITPPQGGRVVFIGVRATNLNPCGVDVKGVIRDEANKHVVLDERTVNLKADGKGWGSSSDEVISTFSNVPVCPNEWSSTDIFGHEYELTMAILDKAGRSAEKTIKATLSCAETDPMLDAECHCICKQGYVLGQTCN